MALIFILELVAGILGYVLEADATNIVQQNMNASMYEYATKPEVHYVWDQVQTNVSNY